MMSLECSITTSVDVRVLSSMRVCQSQCVRSNVDDLREGGKRYGEHSGNGWGVGIIDAIVLGFVMNRDPQVKHRGNGFVARHAEGRMDSHDAS
jgi:hypothetical protein